jgi:hypothetical protein
MMIFLCGCRKFHRFLLYMVYMSGHHDENTSKTLKAKIICKQNQKGIVLWSTPSFCVRHKKSLFIAGDGNI